jgi:hypothetical protein
VDVAALTSHTSTVVAAYNSAIAAGTGKFFLRDTGGAQSSFAGLISTYNNIATDGIGVPGDYSENPTGSVAINTTILTYTPPATADGIG